MRNITVVLITAVLAVFSLSSSTPDFLKDQLKYPRVRAARTEKAELIRDIFKKKGVEYPPAEIFVRVFKLDRTVELWARSTNKDAFRLIKTYEICSLSGHAGPKRRIGDLQVPEGFYYIDTFNPVSSFHLSLGINYPNQSDRILGVAGHLGKDIFIHGSCVTIGCIPITDDCIKELYVIAVEAKANGQSLIPVHIFPTRLDDKKYQSLTAGVKDSKLLAFWENVRQGYVSFEKGNQLPRVSVDAKTGRYIFQISSAIMPSRIQAVIGERVTFSAQALGSNLIYRWQTKYENESENAWSEIPGATGSQLHIVTGDFYQFCAQYRAVITNSVGRTLSATAVPINQLPVPIFTQDLPAEISVTEGSSVTLKARADAASYYRWKRNSQEVQGGSFGNGSYTTPPLTLADNNAKYQVEAVRFAGNHQCTKNSAGRSRTTTIRVAAR